MDMEMDSRWETFRRREKTADQLFVVGVVTTGVYCRPGCPSRLPKPENARFFTNGEEAKAEGFRPCKRCRPDDTSGEAPLAPSITKAATLIEDSEGTPDYAAIARAVGLSRHHFHRAFKSLMGVTPGAYYRSLRESRLVGGLRNGTSVTEAIYDAGYGSSSRFYETLAPALGMKPGAFSKGGAGEVIRYAFGKSSLGTVLVAATEKGICAIQLGTDPAELLEELGERFPKAELLIGDEAFDRLVTETVSLMENPSNGFRLPLHVRGTAFQLRVWNALRDIKPGETLSYRELAARAGAPAAVRAAASACAANKIAVAIPCHRVVRASGALSGYRWGVDRKAALLERERQPQKKDRGKGL
jgi:AraC family transcriptional regulator, regulatory protein of adaptative response / methylated-DNA-[protein]-cysteine methyltransferase